ncbi:MAG TPA: MFS transporter [Cellulomonas sp.]
MTGAQTTGDRQHLVAVLSLFLLTPAVALVLPSVAAVAAEHQVSATTATWIATAPSVAMVPAALATGVLAGARLRYRPLVLGATALFVLAGVLPALVPLGFSALIGVRVLWGAATGVLLTSANSLVALAGDGPGGRARRFATANVVFSVGSVASLLAGGLLARSSWAAPMWGHLVGIPAPVVIGRWLREPEPPAPGTAHRGRPGIPGLALVPMIAFALLVMSVYPVSTLMSVVFAQAGLGAPGTVGLVGSLLTVTGLVVAPAFARLHARLGAQVLTCSAVVCGAGLAMIYLATPAGAGSLALYVVGLLLAGAGLTGSTIGTPVITSELVPPASTSAAQGMVAAALNIGGILSTGFAGMVLPRFGTDEVRPLYLVSAVLVVGIAITLGIVGARTSRTRTRIRPDEDVPGAHTATGRRQSELLDAESART